MNEIFNPSPRQPGSWPVPDLIWGPPVRRFAGGGKSALEDQVSALVASHPPAHLTVAVDFIHLDDQHQHQDQHEDPLQAQAQDDEDESGGRRGHM